MTEYEFVKLAETAYEAAGHSAREFRAELLTRLMARVTTTKARTAPVVIAKQAAPLAGENATLRAHAAAIATTAARDRGVGVDVVMKGADGQLLDEFWRGPDQLCTIAEAGVRKAARAKLPELAAACVAKMRELEQSGLAVKGAGLRALDTYAPELYRAYVDAQRTQGGSAFE